MLTNLHALLDCTRSCQVPEQGRGPFALRALFFDPSFHLPLDLPGRKLGREFKPYTPPQSASVTATPSFTPDIVISPRG